MSRAARKTQPEPEHDDDLLAYARRAAEHGITVKLPSPDPDWELPEPVDLKGLSLGDTVVRLRRCDP